MPLNPLEKQILAECATPNDFVTYIRNGGVIRPIQPGIFELTGTITHWLGSLELFQQNEHKVALVFDVKNMDKVMHSVYGLQMPTDPFKQRSRKLFDQEQSYQISDDNLEWFKNTYRHADYQLLNHIRSQDYYHE